MNSISYLDSVLSRSFAAAATDQRSSSTSTLPIPPNKRSRSHSSLPSTRRASSTSARPLVRASTSSVRRWSQEQDGQSPHQVYNNGIKRTGSTPADLDSAHALDTDDSDEDRSQRRAPRWSALWGLTGWLDEAIHPEAAPRRDSVETEVSSRQATRMLSLDDLHLTQASSQRGTARRTASSASGLRRHRSGSRTSDEDRSADLRRSKRRSRLSASLTLTTDPDERNRWLSAEERRASNDDPDLMSEKEREDIVDFVGGDFGADDVERQRERSASLGSVDSNWTDGPSLSTNGHEREESRDSAQDTLDEKSVDEETLLDAAKGEPEAMDAVAKEQPSLADPDVSDATPTKHRVAIEPHSAPSSCSEASQLRTTTSDGVTKRKRSSRSSSAVTTETETADSNAWTASRSTHAKSGHPPLPKYRKMNLAHLAHKTLLALRDFLVAIMLCPVQLIRYMKGREAIKAHVVDEQRRQLERDPTQRQRLRALPSHPAPKVDAEKEVVNRAIHDVLKPDLGKHNMLVEEPITEEQAAKSAKPWRPSHTRTQSRLLPNPHRIDPMLAHDRRALPIDENMAEKEARTEAERQARIAKARSARAAARAAASGGAEPAVTSEKAALVITSVLSKVPRNPASSVIHHTPKILVLDLDETLIHSTSRSPSQYIGAGGGRTTTSGFLGLEAVGAVLGLRANDNPRRIRPHMVEVVLDGRSVLYHVYKRPWVDFFLRKVASWYTVVVFTASVQEYADPVIDWLDQGRGLISARLFRESCSFKNGSYVKNLAVVDEDLAKVCLVDNSPASYAINRANGVPIESWTHDPNDEALLDLLPILDSLRFATDVRHILGIRGFSSTI